MEKFRKSLIPVQDSWVLNDVANSAFILILVTTLMPIYYQKACAPQLPPYLATSYWGYANSIASAMVALLAPLLGHFSNQYIQKRNGLLITTTIGALFTLLIGWNSPAASIKILGFYVLARVAWSISNLFYDAMLVDVAKKQEQDSLSAKGFAWGYIGGTIPFFLCIYLIKKDLNIFPVHGFRASFVVTALWWCVFAIPLLLIKPSEIRQNVASPKLGNTLSASLALTKKIWNNAPLRVFLLAYFLYIDGVHTIITMATSFGSELGLGMNTLIGVVLMIQIVSFPSSLLFGRLARQYSQIRLILFGIGIYCLVVMGAFLMPYFSIQIQIKMYWILGLGIAFAQGGIQSLSRSYFAGLIPTSEAGSYFGIYHVLGKFAVVLGPLLMAITASFTKSTHYGLLTILLMFAFSAWMLVKIRTE